MRIYKLALVAKDIKNSVSLMVYEHYARTMNFALDFAIHNVAEEEIINFIGFARKNLNGFGVTMPYKQSILKYADIIYKSAQECDACNVMQVKDGVLTAYNTDGGGAIKALLLQGIDIGRKNVLIIGAGGAALSISRSFDKENIAHMTILNRTFSRAKELCEKLTKPHTADVLNDENLVKYCNNADIIINASSIGQVGHVDFSNMQFLENIHKNAILFDINYSNKDAKLLKMAREKGIRTLNGKLMVACQGIEAFEIWTGERPTDRALKDLIEMFQ